MILLILFWIARWKREGFNIRIPARSYSIRVLWTICQAMDQTWNCENHWWLLWYISWTHKVSIIWNKQTSIITYYWINMTFPLIVNFFYNDFNHDYRFITENILSRTTVAICLFCNLYNNPCPFITPDRTTLIVMVHM